MFSGFQPASENFEGRALRNCPVSLSRFGGSNFSEGARLPRWTTEQRHGLQPSKGTDYKSAPAAREIILASSAKPNPRQQQENLTFRNSSKTKE
jgi:hypothetical protein